MLIKLKRNEKNKRFFPLVRNPLLALADLCCQGLAGSGLPAMLPQGNFSPWIYEFSPFLRRFVGFCEADLIGGG